MKATERWVSPRLGQEVTFCRWGAFGQPVLLFPTAGGDAEEVERFLMIDAVSDLLAAGRVKIYSVDSVAGQLLVAKSGSPEHQMWVKNEFQHFIYHEVVPAIRTDCQSLNIGIIAAGASIGAFNALAMVCRFPDVFTHAICMSGTFDLMRLIDDQMTEPFYFASPLHYLPELDGSPLQQLQSRFVLLACGQGRAEDTAESWRAAQVLGSKGVPNRVDIWGEEWHHDWPTWRTMLPLYLDELVAKES